MHEQLMQMLTGGAGGAGGAAAAPAGLSLDGDGMSQLMAFFGNPEMTRMAESVAASFVSGDESAVREAQQAMGSMLLTLTLTRNP